MCLTANELVTPCAKITQQGTSDLRKLRSLISTVTKIEGRAPRSFGGAFHTLAKRATRHVMTMHHSHHLATVTYTQALHIRRTDK